MVIKKWMVASTAKLVGFSLEKQIRRDLWYVDTIKETEFVSTVSIRRQETNVTRIFAYKSSIYKSIRKSLTLCIISNFTKYIYNGLILIGLVHYFFQYIRFSTHCYLINPKQKFVPFLLPILYFYKD